MYIEYRVYGYILGAGTVLYLAGSLRYRRIKQLCFNAPSLQCKSTLYTVFRCILQLLTRQYNVEKSSFKLLYIEYRVYGYIVGACTVPYMAGSLTYRRINTRSYRASNILCNGSPLYLGPARSHFLLYIPMQNIVANTTISR